MSLTKIDENEQIEIWKRTYCRNSTDDEVALFINTCKRTGLSPEGRQIYAVKRWDGKLRREVMSIQTSIDGLRLIAERTGKYLGQEPIEWATEDGKWIDFWPSIQGNPLAARCGVYKAGFNKPVYAIAYWEEYSQTDKAGNLTKFWREKPRLMLAKCSEALALRKAFPQELSGLYTSDEIPHDAADIAGATPARQELIESPAKKMVTTAQLTRMFAIISSRDLTASEVKTYMLEQYGIESSKQLTMDQYQELVTWIEKHRPKQQQIIESDTDTETDG